MSLTSILLPVFLVLLIFLNACSPPSPSDLSSFDWASADYGVTGAEHPDQPPPTPDARNQR